MTVNDQTETIAFLSAPRTHGGASVERIDTHTAVVFLAGNRAYKLKRGVRYDYLDFSTPEARRAFSEAELRLNRRTAPGLYRRVSAVTREADGALALNGSGAAVDWVIEMDRFDQASVFDRLADAGDLRLDLMPQLADAIAMFHRAATPRRDHGGRNGMAWVIDGNARGFEEYGAGCLDTAMARSLTIEALSELDRQAPLLEMRRTDGFVRQCHGDLHLRNIVLLDGQPTLFDGVEFNDEIACIDVFYDVAFLLMDLWRRRLPRHAGVVLNRYLAGTGDLEGLTLLPLFLSCRAAVRAKTSATAARVQADSNRRAELHQLARDYLIMAGRLLRPPVAALVAIGGFSGSGKSTLAMALAPEIGPVPGAMRLRSDEIRKELCGRPELERLGPEGYSPAVTERVYAMLANRAAAVLRAGHGVIVDAVYAHPEERAAIERVAASAAAPFVGLWLDAPESMLIERVQRRTADVSDADEAVVRAQRARDIGVLTWDRLDASIAVDGLLQQARTVIGRRVPGATNDACDESACGAKPEGSHHD
jgi:aminoglycoside phosphotransferase family enzyme/predicted kinase